MAVRTWTSTGSGDWSVAGNWSGGAVPVSNDVVLFSGEFSNVSVTAGLNQSGVDLDALRIERSYSGNVGTSGTYLDISADQVEHRGSGSLYFQSDVTTDVVYCNSNNKTSAMYLQGATISRVVVIKGRCEIGTAVTNTIPNIEVISRDSPDDAICVIQQNSGAAVITDLRQAAGLVTCETPITTATISGGTLRLAKKSTTNLIMFGGLVEMNIDYSLAGTPGIIGYARVYGGLLDMTRTGGTKSVADLVARRRSNVARFVDTAVHSISKSEFILEDRPY